MNNILREGVFTELLQNYKTQGGFGCYPIDTLMGTNITNIQEMIHQEDTIISLHNSTYDFPITRNILENIYLGRKCDMNYSVKLFGIYYLLYVH